MIDCLIVEMNYCSNVPENGTFNGGDQSLNDDYDKNEFRMFHTEREVLMVAAIPTGPTVNLSLSPAGAWGVGPPPPWFNPPLPPHSPPT